MANYVKSTNFAVKDGLAQGDPGKIVKGTEIDIEFNNIASAVGTKADTNSPTFTGVPLAPTATSTTNNTQIATTAFVQSLITATKEAIYPVGSIYTNATNAANPATLLGFGTWSAFGAGRVMVGFNAGDPLFDSAEETGGSKDAIVVSHTHTASTNTASLTGSFGIKGVEQEQSGIVSDGGSSSFRNSEGVGNNGTGAKFDIDASHNHSVTVASAGSSGTNANLPPYITVYLWKRVA